LTGGDDGWLWNLADGNQVKRLNLGGQCISRRSPDRQQFAAAGLTVSPAVECRTISNFPAQGDLRTNRLAANSRPMTQTKAAVTATMNAFPLPKSAHRKVGRKAAGAKVAADRRRDGRRSNFPSRLRH
jgi:hypothetical protein